MQDSQRLPQAPARSALDELAERSPRLACAVEAASRRRDCRELRSRLLLLLLALACPPRGEPRRSWYVPGAVARLGAEGLERAWRGFYGGGAPSLRTIRKHLGELEGACALVRRPGDWMPRARDPEHPERRPRYPQTFELLEQDRDAEWWAREGRHMLAAHPEARANPDAWRRLFRGWRERAARLEREPMLPFEEGLLDVPPQVRADPSSSGSLRQAAGFAADSGGPESSANQTGHKASSPVRGRSAPSAEQLERARAIGRAAMEREPLRCLALLRAAGADVRGSGAQLELARCPERLAAAARLLARALERGDVVRNRAGWILRAVRHFPELRALR